MKKMKNLADESKAVLFIYLFYILASFVSFMYAFITHAYNGDYNDKSVFLSFDELLFILIINIIPIIFTLNLYFHFKTKSVNRFVKVNNSKLEYFSIFMEFIYLFFVVAFGVGKAGGAAYHAPGPIKLLIQIVIRLYPTTWGFIYVYAAPKDKILIKYFIVIINVITSILCLSMGWVVGVGSVIFLLRFREIMKFCKKNILLVCIFLIIFPPVIGLAYNVRDIMRGQITSATSFKPSYLIFSKLFGRFSSFSATAVIYDYKDFFKNKAINFDDLFYQKSMLSFISSKFAPKEVFEQVVTMRDAKNYSFMAGISGILLFSFYIDPLVFFINFVSIFGSIYLIFYFFNKLQFSYKLEYCALTIIMPVVAGTGVSIFSTLLCALVLLFGIMIINQFFVPVRYFPIGGYNEQIRSV